MNETVINPVIVACELAEQKLVELNKVANCEELMYYDEEEDCYFYKDEFQKEFDVLYDYFYSVITKPYINYGR